MIELARLNEELAVLSSGLEKTNKEFEKAEQKAAGALSSGALIKRAVALPEEIWKLASEPWRGTATDKELEREAVTREIRKRVIFVTVHVHETEDVFSDSVYIRAPKGAVKWWSSTVTLDNGDEHTFALPLSSVFPEADPTGSPLYIEAYDEDIEGNDLMFLKSWDWSDLPASDRQSRDGGTYTVRVDFSRP